MSNREMLYAELDRLRKGYIRSRGLLIIVGTLASAMAVFLCSAVLDLSVQLPALLCWVVWLLLLAVFDAGVTVAVRALRQQVTDSAMAVLMEHVLPQADNHLVNAVQIFERVPHSDAFVEELLGETQLNLDNVRHTDLYSQRPRKWILRSLAFMAVFLVALTAMTRKGMAHAAARLLFPMAGVEPYTLTRIASVTPGNASVLRGDDLEVTVQFAGVSPKRARVCWERARGKTEEFDLEPVSDGVKPDGGNLYRCRLKGVFYESRYRIVGGDAKSPRFTIAVTNPPGLEEWRAEIVPPEYVGREKYRLDSGSENLEIPVGSTVGLLGRASSSLKFARVTQDETELAKEETAGRDKFGVKFVMGDGGSIKLGMVATSGLEATTILPFVVVLDQTPSVVLVETKQRILASKDAQVPIGFKVTDDYGVSSVGLRRKLSEEKTEEVTAVTPEEQTPVFTGRFLVDVGSFDVREGETLSLHVWAQDNGPHADRRRGLSALVQITIPVPEERRKAKERVVKQSKDSLLALIKLQRENLKNTRQLTDQVTMGKSVANSQVSELQVIQQNVRDMGVDLLKDQAALGDLATVLSGLVNHEMARVLEAFDEAHRAHAKELGLKLRECVTLEARILATLTGMPTDLAREQQHQGKSDLFTALQKLVAAQRDNMKASKNLSSRGGAAAETKALAVVEDALASDLITFTDLCLSTVESRVDDEFAAQVRQVYDLIEDNAVYDKMLAAAEALDDNDLAVGVQSQEEALRALLQALSILNAWRMKNAERIVKEATEMLKDTADKLEQLEAKQAQIAEVTRDLAARGVMDDEVRKKLAEMDEDQKDMAKMVEEMAQDLYQFPELPVCNELNSKMREIYEDVEQALGSEDAPAIEIAVQKEDSLLDAIRKTKERVEDVEMWLPDIPDNIVWNMESFDADEFPDIPLVPLPDELEDIVGELLDQASSVEAEAQDTTGNNIIADAEMGWGIMDGPMPSFSAKGKSGNMRPNDNEMTGRSGAGREGQSTGELVENHVKGLEGRKTHARRTLDPFQKGMVTEDEDSTLDARSTGGGKLGGESESAGMFGKAPRRDLHTGDHGEAPTKLRQETEALYATARLLYLGTGSLGAVARELRGVEDASQKMRSFGSLHRRVLRRLEDTQVELSSGVVLPMPVASVSKTGGAAVEDVDIGQIAEEYRDIVSDYYRSLGQEQ